MPNMLVEPKSTNNFNEYNNNYIYNYVENNTNINYDYNNNIYNNIINHSYNSRRRSSSRRNNQRVDDGNSSPGTQTPPWRGNNVKCPFCRRECQCNEWTQTDEVETCDICFHSKPLCKSSQCGHKMCAECLERIRR